MPSVSHLHVSCSNRAMRGSTASRGLPSNSPQCLWKVRSSACRKLQNFSSKHCHLLNPNLKTAKRKSVKSWSKVGKGI
uniref:Uncharacterized protein n=1 Tax=Strigamia maritima TaxID=126957 RepID=T1JHQ1_STRMM